jgi:menaquinone-dependent protoporphyrinogen oxidase
VTSVLVAYGTGEGQTGKIAAFVGSVLEAYGHDATVVDLRATPEQSVAGFDAVLVGSPVHNRRHHPAVVSFVERERAALAERPSGFFQTSLASIMPLRWAQRGAREFVDGFVEETGWEPDRVGTFAGAVKYTQYDRWTRFTFRLVSALTTGDTDTSRDYEYTDWGEVEEFTLAFAAHATHRVGSTPPEVPRPAPLALVGLGFALGYWWARRRGAVSRESISVTHEGSGAHEVVGETTE